MKFAQGQTVSEITSNLEQYLNEAKQQREIAKKRKKEKVSPKEEPKTKETEPKIDRSETEEESLHSKAQCLLIELGKITGTSIWIASNDRNRSYKGKRLGDDCLNSLPNMGLSPEATLEYH